MKKRAARSIMSLTLVYPDENFWTIKDELLHLTLQVPEPTAGELKSFFTSIQEMTLVELQRHYVEVFDMRRKCSLYLTSWTHGDTRNRGMAILYFKQIYQRFGMIISDEELPDHLSAVLEFSVFGDENEGDLLLAEHRAAIELLRNALQSAGSPYAHILNALISTLPALNNQVEARIRALAISGPPQEFVGMSGAVTVALEPFSSRPSHSFAEVLP